MKIPLSVVFVAVLALAIIGAAPATAQSDNVRPVPTRFVISNPGRSDLLPASVQFGGSRFRSGYASGRGRFASATPRFVSGAMTRQKFEVYGNSANTTIPLSIYTPGDLRAGISPRDFRAFDRPADNTPTRLTASRYVLDLRQVSPGNRLALLTRVVGPERARRAMDEAYAAAGRER